MSEIKNENRVLIFSLIIVVLLIVVTLNSNISGYAVSDFSRSNIEVSPNVVYQGDKIIITVHPSNDGINGKASFYNLEDNLRKTSVDGLCNSYRCSDSLSFSFFIPNNWENGIYYVQVYDYGSEDFVKEEFTVIKA